MSDTLNWIYEKNKGKKYIAEELKIADFKQSDYNENTFYTTITPFEEQDDRKSIEVTILLDLEKINLSLIGRYGEIRISTKIPENCFVYPKCLGTEQLQILLFIDTCISKFCQNVNFINVKNAEKILKEYSENY